jgi:hypothetical protein
MPTTYAIPDGRTVMAATTYTGTGASLTVSNAVNGVSFQPDWVWIKRRDGGQSHQLYDVIRGANQALYSNLTLGETPEAYGLSAFTTSGFTVISDIGVNTSNGTYVGWNWKAGGTAVTNNDGSVASQVSANTTAGFSVVKFTSPASGSFDVGHGLSAVPNLIITKPTSRSAGWVTYHSSLNGGNPGTSYFVYLDTTAGQASLASPPMWGSAVPTSSKFGASVGATCAGSESLIAYCFAAVAGYSAFGSYDGNNVADGPFVYLGFRPRFIMIKSTSASTEWVMIDTTRSSYNLSDTSLYANRNYSESTIGTVDDIDILSNGFKLRNNTGFVNSSQTYIYAAFAEVPFKFANAR